MANKKTIRKRRLRPHAEPLYLMRRSLFKHVPLAAQRQMEPADSFSTRSPFDEYEVVPVEFPPPKSKSASPIVERAKRLLKKLEIPADMSPSKAHQEIVVWCERQKKERQRKNPGARMDDLVSPSLSSVQRAMGRRN